MEINKITPVVSIPSEEKLAELVNNLGYKRMGIELLPIEKKSNKLVNKFNSVIIAASGSSEIMCYTIIGLRPDDENSVIDEHPFVFAYNKNHPTQSFGGIIHHGSWPERTYSFSLVQINLHNLNGITTEFSCKSIPMNTSRSLEDLNKNNMFKGINDQFRILLNMYKR